MAAVPSRHAVKHVAHQHTTRFYTICYRDSKAG